MPAAGALDSGRYQIGRLLGRGGLGEVYLAHDRTLDRDVAIKFVNPDKVADASARRALLREARASAALDHPYICTVYETGETLDGHGFIVMQYVEGEPLSAVLAQGAMSVRDALSLCADIADALAAAHRRGVIHRDLKPGNIIVTPSGHPKLVDFGIAKVTLTRALPAEESTVTGGTLDDVLVGTPAYMSPEQVQKLPVDGRSDLFALGLLLFECLTGRRAFRGSNALAIFADILQVHPPPPSSMRVGLTGAHDELCRRLLAKEPSDRFQSAEEVVGAIRLLLPDTSRTPAPVFPWLAPATGRWSKRTMAWAAGALAVAAIAGAAIWNRGSGLPEVPENSQVWYRRGSEALREGSYHTARRALNQAVKLFPDHALAYARLAEVDAELDDSLAAQGHLLRVSSIVPDESRLPDGERLRLQAVRAHVLRDVDGATKLYRELVAQNPGDPRALVDLGRAQETAGRRTDARASYEQAIAADPQYAAAYLRLGTLEGLEARWKEALAAFGEAERLYKASTDGEGQTEVLLNRGAVLESMGEPKKARGDLERALLLASSTSESSHQRIRAQLALSVVTASEGQVEEAARMASAAVDDALAEGLDTIAAGGLVDLAATLLFAAHAAKDELAEKQLDRARELAERRGAPLTTARAKIQLAEVYTRSERREQALALLDSVLPFLKEKRYRRHELTALTISSLAYEGVGKLDEARRIASEVLSVAQAIGDETQEAVAASSLASITTALGLFPEALRLRERADAIHRRQNDKALLPYDLTNRADLLIRLGRHEDAAPLLKEMEAGIAAGVGSYIGRRRRVTFLRAFEAVTLLRCDAALPLLRSLESDARATDPAATLVPAIRRFCEAAPARPPSPLADVHARADKTSVRERQYWIAAAALRGGDAPAAAAAVNRGFELLGEIPNDELRWRLAAIGSAAARQRGDGSTAARMAETARLAADRLRATWQNDADRYERRPDLADLKKKDRT
jgi:tetratricopeptide (TPR) repeat protein/predicted Ser/Thr protein kinase